MTAGPRRGGYHAPMDATKARALALGAALLLACRTEPPPGPEDGASTGSGISSTGGPSPGTTDGSGSGEATAGGSTATGSSSGGDGTTHATSTTAADEESTGGSPTSGTTGEPTSACQQGCAVEWLCTMDWPSEQACVSACEANLIRAAAFAPACADAWAAVSECLGTLTCEEYLEWRMPTAFPYPCVEADEGLQFECNGQ